MIYWFYCVVMAIFLEPHKTLTAIVKLTQYKHDPDLDPRFNPPPAKKTTEILHSKLWKSTIGALFLSFFLKLPSLVALFNNLFSQYSAFCLHSVTFLSIHKGAVSEQNTLGVQVFYNCTAQSCQSLCEMWSCIRDGGGQLHCRAGHCKYGSIIYWTVVTGWRQILLVSNQRCRSPVRMQRQNLSTVVVIP